MMTSTSGVSSTAPRLFLPHLIASGDGHVVNISSVFGLLAVPGQGAYNAAKFAVRGFTEALRQEMIVAGHPVKVTTVHPAASRPGSPATWRPRRAWTRTSWRTVRQAVGQHVRVKAARVILEGVRKNKARVLVGNDAKALDILVRVTGSGYQRVVAAVTSRTMPD